ncbi:MAG TPA: M48 family metalloprotease [Candidatus Eisenbacteria bacterium]|nr:M48 family metalloprotease [Candidatus Eisenbacteria bacterium]
MKPVGIACALGLIWVTIASGASPAEVVILREGSLAKRASVTSQSQIERVRRIMLPLIEGAGGARRTEEIRIRIIEEPSINAGSAGDGQFIVTTGLLEKANDDQLRGVLAHEIAHDRLGHPRRAQLLWSGLGLGTRLLEQFIPGSGALAPVAAALLAHRYSQPQEYEADRYAVKILHRSGYSKEIMIDTLEWLKQTSGDGGGFLSTHPALSDRIRALRARS